MGNREAQAGKSVPQGPWETGERGHDSHPSLPPGCGFQGLSSDQKHPMHRVSVQPGSTAHRPT